MRPTEPFRQEHEALLSHIAHVAQAAREMPRLSEEERAAVRARVLDFLRETLIPHAESEERFLYPEWATIVGFPDAAIPMIHDHRAIVARVEQLERADIRDVDLLPELLYGLSALIEVHFRKEEDIQLAALDEAPEVTTRVLHAMGDAPGHAHR